MDYSLIYLHQPKTGGTTTKGFLKRNFHNRRSFQIEKPYHKNIEQFKNLSDNQKTTIDLLYGHFGHGIHKFLPQKCFYFSIIREPIKRVISHYNYDANKNSIPKKIANKKGNILSFEDYFFQWSKRFNNGQVRLLSAENGEFFNKGYEFGKCDTEMLEKAKGHVRQNFLLLGLLEEFDKSLMILAKKCGLSLPIYIKKKVSKDRVKHSINNKELELIYKYNQLDLEFYDWAKNHFYEEVHKMGKAFQKKVHYFQYLNKGAQVIYPFLQNFRR